MYLRLDCPVRDLISQILENNSTHSVLYYLAELNRHYSPEEFADKANKLLNIGEED